MANNSYIFAKTVKHKDNTYDLFFYLYGKIVSSYYNIERGMMLYKRSQWMYNARAKHNLPTKRN